MPLHKSCIISTCEKTICCKGHQIFIILSFFFHGHGTSLTIVASTKKNAKKKCKKEGEKPAISRLPKKNRIFESPGNRNTGSNAAGISISGKINPLFHSIPQFSGTPQSSSLSVPSQFFLHRTAEPIADQWAFSPAPGDEIPRRSGQYGFRRKF